MVKSAGFTLVELMVTVTLVALLALAAAPMAEGWIKSAQLEKDTAAVKTALGLAKATALRNQGGKIDDGTSALLCRAGEDLNVYGVTDGLADAVSASCTNSNNVSIWTGKLGGGVTLVYATNKNLCSARVNKKGEIKFCNQEGSSCAATCDPSSELTLSITGGYSADPISVF